MFIIAYSVPAGTLLAAQPEDDWVAHPMYISPFDSPTPIGYNVTQIRTAYKLPSSGGAGTTIAVIDAYDTPNILNYFNTFSSQYGLPDNSTGNFIVHKMPGTSTPPPSDIGWQLETCLDVEWAHAIAPDAKILLVEAVAPTDTALLSAIDYATSQSGVVAVSMSWGGEEFSDETSYYYESHFNKPGITFFASSGDDGSNVIWPAASANVVNVGGTTLNLSPDGTVISETAWHNSSGGVSNYVAIPSFQTHFGLNYSNRAVPDVSYNADVDSTTGFSVYNGTWRNVGGTSAGAPQWAAIHALGLSATNTNLYNRAKAAYSSYFRDITVGSNFVNSTTTGYDLVTGLGSPLTTNFGTEVTVTPTSGPANGSVSINGVGFALSSSVNISYRNPISSSWIPLFNNLTITSDTFSYPFNAPDLLQNNTAGDSQPQFDKIIFKVVDNNNRSYNTTVPYTEWRRGLTQIGNITATGLFGNNTDLATSVFVQNGDVVPVVGDWFNPGNVSLLWDNMTNAGIISTDSNGFFNAIMQVPNTTAGPHVLTINDGVSNFCINITRLPSTTHDYIDGWHTSDFPINLTCDYSVNETFYSINSGPIFNVTANGQPTITTEASNSTLEYWSTWNVYGTGNMELSHVTLTGIKLDKTAPTSSITVNSNYVNSGATVTFDAGGSSDVSGIASYLWDFGDGSVGSGVTTTHTYVNSGTYPAKVTIQDSAGNIATATVSVTVAPQPTPTPSPSPSPTIKPTPTITSPSPAQTSQSPSPSATPQVPELNIQIILILLAASTLMLALIFKRSRK